MGFTSFSQFGEDAQIYSLLREASVQTRPGNYIDVGSGDPVRGSNTYALYRMGWRGTLIDPIENNIADSGKFRPEDKVIQACVGAASGELEFYEFETYEYSTSSPERIAEMLAGGSVPKATYKVPLLSLADLGIRMSPEESTLISIDVEGGEWDVLQGIDWDACRPGLFVVEEWQGPLNERTLIQSFLEELGYGVVGIAGYSSIYRHERFPR